MNRAWDVFFGVCLIATVWTWMAQATEWKADSWWSVWLIVSHIILACFMTAPIYREYLR